MTRPRIRPVAASYLDGPLGRMLLATTPQGLCGLWFTQGQRDCPPHADWPLDATHPVLVAATEQLRRYFDGRLHRFELPLDLGGGTAFQQQAWRALLDIGWGETIRYGELARRMGRPAASRAAGVAIGRNPISIVVPCHRVVGAGGALTGYAGGLARKRWLLQLEASGSPPPFDAPH
jgi:methylated-DNA-[protein]-cysteine S-methyltransferase